MRRFHILAVAVGLAGAGIAAPPARGQAYSAERVVTSVGLEDLKAVVGSLGHTIAQEQTIGPVSLTATDAEGTNYILIGTACDDSGVSGCRGVMMQVRFDPEGSVTTDALARANLSQAAVNTWRDPSNGAIGVTRYVVLDLGITMANLRENVNVLLSLTPGVVDVLLSE